MQTFIDSTNQQVYQFDDDVVVEVEDGKHSFYAPNGDRLELPEGLVPHVYVPPAQSPPVPQTRFSVREYIKRFTLAEQITIRQAQLADMEVGLVYDDLNRAEFIDVTDPDVERGIDLYIGKGLLDPGRKAELLAPDTAPQ